MYRTGNKRHLLLICAALAVATFAAFSPALKCDFLAFDDQDYVTQNETVRAGLTLHGMTWAFTHQVMGNWHPLTMLSHMLDCSLFGLNPVGPHAVNLLLHTLNVLLCFLLLHRCTGTLWRSAIVAALFGLHPLRVESVAWIAERKDVLSSFFFFLTLLAYVGYIRATTSPSSITVGAQPAARGALRRAPQHSAPNMQLAPPFWRKPAWNYCLSLFFFILGLMSKPMLVTLPFVLLLMDYWPLRRFAGVASPTEPKQGTPRIIGRLLLEKLPFFALTLIFCVAAFLAQRICGTVLPLQELPLRQRLENAFVAIVAYLWKMIWPAKLAAFYVAPRAGWPEWEAALAILFVGVLSLAALRLALARKLPFATVGWFWFIGMLVPVLGIVQVGMQAYADRYTYLPMLGCFILLVWGGAELVSRFRLNTTVPSLGTAVVIIGLGAATYNQTGYWKSSVLLFTHCAAVTKDNIVAENNLAATLIMAEKYGEAEKHCLEALRIYPQFAMAMQNLGVALTMEGDFQRAKSYLDQAVALDPQAAFQYRKLANALNQKGQSKPAIDYFSIFLRLKPDDPMACNNLAWLVATAKDPTLRDGAEAVRLAEHACSVTQYKLTVFVGTLAAAYAEAGRFEDAIAAAQKAIQLAQANGEKEIEQRNRQLLQLYQAGKPFHEG